MKCLCSQTCRTHKSVVSLFYASCCFPEMQGAATSNAFTILQERKYTLEGSAQPCWPSANKTKTTNSFTWLEVHLHTSLLLSRLESYTDSHIRCTTKNYQIINGENLLNYNGKRKQKDIRHQVNNKIKNEINPAADLIQYNRVFLQVRSRRVTDVITA